MALDRDLRKQGFNLRSNRKTQSLHKTHLLGFTEPDKCARKTKFLQKLRLDEVIRKGRSKTKASTKDSSI